MGPQPGGGQLGAGSEQAFDDQGHDQVALPRALGGEQPLKTQPAQGSQHGLDVALGPGAFDEEGLRRGDEGFAGQGAADDVDQGSGQVGEIAEGFVLDLLADAYGAAEQVGGIGTALVAAFIYGYVNGTGSGWHKSL